MTIREPAEGAAKEHRIAVHEIADGRRDAVASRVGFRGQFVFGKLPFRTKISDLVRLRFEVLEIEIPQHEVEHRNAGPDIFERVLAAVAEILPANFAVNLP